MTNLDRRISAGFIPLTDCAPLIVACECGFARDEGLELKLVRETSWATIRDRLAVGHLDVAHALASPVLGGVGVAVAIVVGVVSLAWLPGLALRVVAAAAI